MNTLTFSQAIEGYLLNAGARHLSPHTIADYLNTFHKFEDYAEDNPCFVAISQNDIQEFLVAKTSLSNKTLLNCHTGLSALWSWAVKEQVVSVNVGKRNTAAQVREAGNCSIYTDRNKSYAVSPWAFVYLFSSWETLFQ